MNSAALIGHAAGQAAVDKIYAAYKAGEKFLTFKAPVMDGVHVTVRINGEDVELSWVNPRNNQPVNFLVTRECSYINRKEFIRPIGSPTFNAAVRAEFKRLARHYEAARKVRGNA